MKALTFQAPFDVRVEEVPDPGVRDPRDVVLRVDLAAICGSDLHVYRGHETGLDRGTVMGHELVGTVVEAGADAALAVGTQVACPFTTSCGACYYCELGMTARCEQGALFGWVEGPRGLHGTQAELLRVPLADTTLVPIPEGVSPELALLTGDVLATGFFCAEMGRCGEGHTVAVLGCGPIGVSAVTAARELGARLVLAIDTVPERLELAAAAGGVPLDFRATDVARAALDATDGRGVDLVLECVGSHGATRSAYDLVRPGGVIAACGVHTDAHFAFSPGEAYDKNLTYVAGRCSARPRMERLLGRMAEGALDLSALFSHRLPLSEGRDGYKLFAEPAPGCTKVLLTP